MSDAERARLIVQGGGTTVSFTRRGRPYIFGGPQEIVNSIEHWLKAEGRRRLPTGQVLSALPAAGGAAAVILWAVIIAVHRPDGLTIALGSLLVIGAATASVFATIRARRATANANVGHRFRQGTRAAFRDALTNVRAQILIGGGGTLLGVLATVAVQKLFGIHPA